MKLELCQCENKYDIRTGVTICTECGKTKIGVPFPTFSTGTEVLIKQQAEEMTRRHNFYKEFYYAAEQCLEKEKFDWVLSFMEMKKMKDRLDFPELYKELDAPTD